MRIWNRMNLKRPDGIVIVWPAVAVSAATAPPNQAQLVPANGGTEVPQPSWSQMGVPKLVELCTVQRGQGEPPSYVPSWTPGAMGEQPVGCAEAIPTVMRHSTAQNPMMIVRIASPLVDMVRPW